jgi:hypothetical protein
MNSSEINLGGYVRIDRRFLIRVSSVEPAQIVVHEMGLRFSEW